MSVVRFEPGAASARPGDAAEQHGALAARRASSVRALRDLTGRRLGGWLGPAWGPTAVAVLLSAVLELAWLRYLALSGGDMAAQEAWAQFVRQHPGSAYDLAWYGGIHPVSYSVIAPFVMATVGVRATLVVASILASGMLTWLATRHELPGRSSYLVAAASACAFLGNALSGRVTFALGSVFALAALVVTVAGRPGPSEVRPRRQYVRAVAAGVLAACATASSPVAGLFLGLAAAALWLRNSRMQAYWLGLPAVAVVALSAVFFPFSGRQPMTGNTVILPVVMGLAVVLLTPRQWPVLRVGGGIYIAATLLAWLVPSPVGSNIVRLGLVFGGVALLVSWARGRWRTSALASSAGPRLAGLALGAALITSLVWQVVVPVKDVAQAQAPVAWRSATTQLADRLDQLHAELGRVEVVPTRTHLESAVLARHVSLARGWNRQADVDRDDLFYDHDGLTAAAYRTWLDRWAVRYVALSSADPDTGGVTEARLISGGLSYLTPVWSNSLWTLYAVRSPTPLVTPPVSVVSFDAAALAITAPGPGVYQIRIVASPWLSLVDADGHPLPSVPPDQAQPACLSSVKTDEGVTTLDPGAENWVTLHVTVPGTYRIGAPYKLPRGSSCHA